MADAIERLMLQVDASVELLRRELAAGERPMEQLEKRAARMADSVDGSIAKMGSRFGEFARLADDSAKRAERSFEASFAQVRTIAGQAIKGPTIDGKIDLGIEELRRQSAEVGRQAQAYQLITEAMQRAALAAGDTSQATRLAIQAADAQRIEAERTSAALAQEAGALERVQIELMQSAQAVEVFVTSHQRIAQAAQIDRDAAEAATRLAGAQQLLAREAIEVRSAIDPMYAAQVRFDQEMEKADRLLAAGVFGQREYGQAVQVARDRLQQHAIAVAGNVSQEVKHAKQLGRTQAAMQGISYQAQDTFTQLSMGANVFNVLAVQGMQATGQMTLLDGKVGKFAQTMQGPWGLAISAGILVLGALTKDLDLFDDKLGDAIDKLKKDAKETALNEQAKRIYGRTLDGVTTALVENKKALDQLADAGKTAARQALENALNENLKLKVIRAQTAALVENAKAYLEVQRSRASGPGQGAELAALDLPRRQAQLDALKGALKSTDDQIAEADRQIQEALSRRVVERAARQAEELIREKYDRQIEAVRRRAVAEKTVSTELNRQVKALEKQRDVELEAEQRRQQRERKAERDAEREAGRAGTLTRFVSPVDGGRVSSGFGPRTAPKPGASTFHKGIDIAAPIGTAVKSAAGGVVIHAGRLGGLGNAIIVDHGGGTITEYGHLSSVLVQRGQRVQQGDRIGAVGNTGISTGPHLDYRVKVRGKYVDPRTGRFATDETAVDLRATRAGETTARREEAAERRELRDDTAFTRDYLQARRKLLDATARTATSADREALAREEIEAEAVAEQREIGNRLKAGSISAEQALMQSAVVEGTRKQRLQNIEIDKATRLIEARYDTAAEEGASRLDVLRIQQDTAATERERRRIGREILDLEQQLRRQTLERVRDTSQDPLAVQRARDQLGRLPEVEAAEDTRFAQQASSPIEAYRDRLKAATSDTTNALQSIAVDGFGRLEDAGASAAAQAVTDLLGIGGVAGDVIGGVVADLARLAIQKAIVASIGGGIFGFADGGALSVLPGFADGGIPGFAGGGSPGGLIRGPGTGRSDSILAMLSNGKGAIRVSNKEFIVNAAATSEWLPELAAINSGRLKKFAGGGLIAPSMPTLREPRPNYARMRSAAQDRLQVDTRVRVEASDMLLAKVEDTTVRTVGAAAEPIMAGATSKTMRKLSRPGLPGGWG